MNYLAEFADFLHEGVTRKLFEQVVEQNAAFQALHEVVAHLNHGPGQGHTHTHPRKSNTTVAWKIYADDL